MLRLIIGSKHQKVDVRTGQAHLPRFLFTSQICHKYVHSLRQFWSVKWVGFVRVFRKSKPVRTISEIPPGDLILDPNCFNPNKLKRNSTAWV